VDECKPLISGSMIVVSSRGNVVIASAAAAELPLSAAVAAATVAARGVNAISFAGASASTSVAGTDHVRDELEVGPGTSLLCPNCTAHVVIAVDIIGITPETFELNATTGYPKPPKSHS